MYEKKGQVANNVGQVITLIIGVGVASLVLIFVGSLGGQVYEAIEDDICDLNTGGKGTVGCTEGISNTNVYEDVRSAIQSSFEAIETSGQYLPIIVLAVVIFIVLGLVTGMGGRQSYGGGAL